VRAEIVLKNHNSPTESQLYLGYMDLNPFSNDITTVHCSESCQPDL